MRVLWRAVLMCLLVALAPLRSVAQTEPAEVDPATERFVLGFVRFLAYHEAGHLLMAQLADLNNNPDWSAADREDYADQFAVILLQPDARDPDGLEELMSAAAGWLQVDSSVIRNEPHAPPEQRARDIVCLVYGSDPEAFAQLSDLTDPGTDCVATYQAVKSEIDQVFRPQSDEMGKKISVVWVPPAPDMEAARNFLSASGVVDDLKFDIESDFILTHRTSIQVMGCRGNAKPDTFYFDMVRGPTPDQDHYVITLCYEMVDARLKYGMRGFEGAGTE